MQKQEHPLKNKVKESQYILNDHGKNPISIKGDGGFIRNNTPIANFTVLVLMDQMKSSLEEMTVELNMLITEKEKATGRGSGGQGYVSTAERLAAKEKKSQRYG